MKILDILPKKILLSIKKKKQVHKYADNQPDLSSFEKTEKNVGPAVDSSIENMTKSYQDEEKHLEDGNKFRKYIEQIDDSHSQREKPEGGDKTITWMSYLMSPFKSMSNAVTSLLKGVPWSNTSIKYTSTDNPLQSIILGKKEGKKTKRGEDENIDSYAHVLPHNLGSIMYLAKRLIHGISGKNLDSNESIARYKKKLNLILKNSQHILDDVNNRARLYGKIIDEVILPRAEKVKESKGTIYADDFLIKAINHISHYIEYVMPAVSIKNQEGKIDTSKLRAIIDLRDKLARIEEINDIYKSAKSKAGKSLKELEAFMYLYPAQKATKREKRKLTAEQNKERTIRIANLVGSIYRISKLADLARDMLENPNNFKDILDNENVRNLFETSMAIRGMEIFPHTNVEEESKTEGGITPQVSSIEPATKTEEKKSDEAKKVNEQISEQQQQQQQPKEEEKKGEKQEETEEGEDQQQEQEQEQQKGEEEPKPTRKETDNERIERILETVSKPSSDRSSKPRYQSTRDLWKEIGSFNNAIKSYQQKDKPLSEIKLLEIPDKLTDTASRLYAHLYEMFPDEHEPISSVLQNHNPDKHQIFRGQHHITGESIDIPVSGVNISNMIKTIDLLEEKIKEAFEGREIPGQIKEYLENISAIRASTQELINNSDIISEKYLEVIRKIAQNLKSDNLKVYSDKDELKKVSEVAKYIEIILPTIRGRDDRRLAKIERLYKSILEIPGILDIPSVRSYLSSGHDILHKSKRSEHEKQTQAVDDEVDKKVKPEIEKIYKGVARTNALKRLKSMYMSLFRSKMMLQSLGVEFKEKEPTEEHKQITAVAPREEAIKAKEPEPPITEIEKPKENIEDNLDKAKEKEKEQVQPPTTEEPNNHEKILVETFGDFRNMTEEQKRVVNSIIESPLKETDTPRYIYIPKLVSKLTQVSEKLDGIEDEQAVGLKALKGLDEAIEIVSRQLMKQLAEIDDKKYEDMAPVLNYIPMNHQILYLPDPRTGKSIKVPIFPANIFNLSNASRLLRREIEEKITHEELNPGDPNYKKKLDNLKPILRDYVKAINDVLSSVSTISENIPGIAKNLEKEVNDTEKRLRDNNKKLYEDPDAIRTISDVTRIIEIISPAISVENQDIYEPIKLVFDKIMNLPGLKDEEVIRYYLTRSYEILEKGEELHHTFYNEVNNKINDIIYSHHTSNQNDLIRKATNMYMSLFRTKMILDGIGYIIKLKQKDEEFSKETEGAYSIMDMQKMLKEKYGKPIASATEEKRERDEEERQIGSQTMPDNQQTQVDTQGNTQGAATTAEPQVPRVPAEPQVPRAPEQPAAQKTATKRGNPLAPNQEHLLRELASYMPDIVKTRHEKIDEIHGKYDAGMPEARTIIDANKELLRVGSLLHGYLTDKEAKSHNALDEKGNLRRGVNLSHLAINNLYRVFKQNEGTFKEKYGDEWRGKLSEAITDSILRRHNEHYGSDHILRSIDRGQLASLIEKSMLLAEKFVSHHRKMEELKPVMEKLARNMKIISLDTDRDDEGPLSPEQQEQEEAMRRITPKDYAILYRSFVRENPDAIKDKRHSDILEAVKDYAIKNLEQYIRLKHYREGVGKNREGIGDERHLSEQKIDKGLGRDLKELLHREGLAFHLGRIYYDIRKLEREDEPDTGKIELLKDKFREGLLRFAGTFAGTHKHNLQNAVSVLKDYINNKYIIHDEMGNKASYRYTTTFDEDKFNEFVGALNKRLERVGARLADEEWQKISRLKRFWMRLWHGRADYQKFKDEVKSAITKERSIKKLLEESDKFSRKKEKYACQYGDPRLASKLKFISKVMNRRIGKEPREYARETFRGRMVSSKIKSGKTPNFRSYTVNRGRRIHRLKSVRNILS